MSKSGFKKAEQHHSVQNVFLFMLMGLFVALAMILVMLSIRSYQATVDKSEKSIERRVAQQYVYSVLRSEGMSARVTVEEADGIKMLVVTVSYYDEDLEEEDSYVRRIYAYEGSLYEMYVSGEREFKPEDGDVVCSVASFEPSLTENGIVVCMTDDNGETFEVVSALRGSAGGQ